MPRFIRIAVLSMTAIALTSAVCVRAQGTQTKSAPAAGNRSAAAAGSTGGIRQEIPGQNDVLATIVDGNCDR